MIEAKINRLGKLPYVVKITGRIKNQDLDTVVIGFDTEYDSKTSELICFQLWYEKKGFLIEVHKDEILTPEWLYEEVLTLTGKKRIKHITFITYFSAAELQFLDVIGRGFNIMEYSRGFADVDFRVKTSCLTFFDVSRWFDGRSLKDAALSFGLEKYEYDTSKVKRSCLIDPIFVKYAKHDAYLCYEIMQRLRQVFLSECGVEPLKVKTPASAAADAFRNLYVKEDIYNDNNQAKLLGMRGAWGGHAEVFKRGRFNKNISEYDIRKAYSNSAISLKEMPCKGSWKSLRKITTISKYKSGFARIIFKFPDKVRFPCFPVFVDHTHSKCMLYPLQGESYCTFDEIRIGLELGAEIQLIEGFGYKTGTSAVSDFCQWTLEKGSTAKGAAKVMYKLLGNSLIGKMAQNLKKIQLDEYLKIIDENPEFLLDELLSLPKEFAIALGAKERVSVGSVFMPEYFGLITGRTRAELAYALNTCNPYYCHTDSVWSDTPPKSRWLQWDKKFSAKQCTIIRTRFAGIGDYKSLKRVKDGKGKIAFHSIWNATAGCQMLSKFNGIDFTRKYPVRRPLRFHEAVRKSKRVGQWETEYRTGSTDWDYKRKLFKNGSTRPYKDKDEHLKEVIMAKKAKKSK